jgi:sugar/nucleoside kinase (ribokinase family)
MQTCPDYLIIGHVTKDLQPHGEAPHAGGTATYAAIAAQRLGMQAAIVTALASEDDYLLDGPHGEEIWVHAIPSAQTTTFCNIYDPKGRRTQTLSARASAITFDDVPSAWRNAPIVHLGPVAQELPAGMAGLFPRCLLGVTPQGWMRSWDKSGHVRQSALPISAALHSLPTDAVIVLSMEDIGFDAATLREYALLADTMVVTQTAGDALIFRRGQPSGSVPALKAAPVDPTGAGDVFAAAFFVRYRETSDPLDSAHFAHAAAAIAIEGHGTQSIARKRQTDDRRRTTDDRGS